MNAIALRLAVLPLIPLLYLDGKKLRKSITPLPEAKNPIGQITGQFSRELKLVILGESTMAGVGVESHDQGFAGHLSSALSTLSQASITYNVMAKNGYTAAKVCQRLIKSVPKDADIIVIGLGGNDAFALNSPSKWNASIREIISLLRNRIGPEVPIFFTNMPPIKEFPAFTSRMQFALGNWVEYLGAQLHKLIQAYPNSYYDHEILSLDHFAKELDAGTDKRLLFSDGIHPSALTYQLWANRFAKFILAKKSLF